MIGISPMAKGAAANKAAVVMNAKMAFTGSLASPRNMDSKESFAGTLPFRLRKRMAPSSNKMPSPKTVSDMMTQFWLMSCVTVTKFSPAINTRNSLVGELKN